MSGNWSFHLELIFSSSGPTHSVYQSIPLCVPPCILACLPPTPPFPPLWIGHSCFTLKLGCILSGVACFCPGPSILRKRSITPDYAFKTISHNDLQQIYLFQFFKFFFFTEFILFQRIAKCGLFQREAILSETSTHFFLLPLSLLHSLLPPRK